MDNIKYVGMDVHKTITVIAVLNARGQMVPYYFDASQVA
jgi:hypothetical protein